MTTDDAGVTADLVALVVCGLGLGRRNPGLRGKQFDVLVGPLDQVRVFNPAGDVDFALPAAKARRCAGRTPAPTLRPALGQLWTTICGWESRPIAARDRSWSCAPSPAADASNRR